MINVLATIELKPGTREEFLQHFNDNVPAVLGEVGCIEYFPSVDFDSGLEVQSSNPNSVTVIEKWESLAALTDHLRAPHMAEYKEKVKDMVVDLSLKVLQRA
ncbi:MAG: putative quinol monooxygenase [Mariniblastus sp.]